MEAKNYRVGNIVEQPSRIGKISEVWQDAVRLEGYNNGYDYKHTRPIQLSEKWLIDFGFQKYHAWEYRWVTGGLQLIETNGFWYPAVFSHPEMSHEDDQCVSLNRIQHIHELQNLFFAITGEELELKEVGSTCG